MPAPPARAGSCRRNTSRRSARTASRRRRSARDRTSSSRSRPASSWCCEAFEGYWRKTPTVKRLVFKVIPDEATRLAALKRGEVDIAYSIRGELAEELTRTPGLTLKPAVGSAPFWLYFPDSGIRSRRGTIGACAQAANLAIDHKTINQALTLGYSRPDRQHHSRRISSSTGSRRRRSTIRRSAQASCWPRPGIRAASMPATITATPPTPISPRWC